MNLIYKFLPYIIILIFALSGYFLGSGSLGYIKKFTDFLMKALKKMAKMVGNESFWPNLTKDVPVGFDKSFAWSRLKVKPSKGLVTVFIVSGMFLSFLLKSSFLSILVIIIIVAYLAVVLSAANKRREKIVSQLPDSLLALVSSLKAGFSIHEAIKIVERETSQPVSELFGCLRRAGDYNLSIVDAIKIIAEKLDLPEWDLISETLIVQYKVGGNIIPVLEAVAQTLRDKHQAEMSIKTATAAGKYSGIMIALLVPISFTMMHFIAPEYIRPLYTTFAGKSCLLFAAVSEVVGFAWIMKVVKVDF